MRKFLPIVLLLFLSLGNLAAQKQVLKTQGIPRPEIQQTQKKATTRTSLSKQSVPVTQGVLRPDLVEVIRQANQVKKAAQDNETFSFDDIRFWVGEGENQAALVVDWYYDDETALVWGYRWDGDATGIDMITAIAQADVNFLLLTQNTNLGSTIAGIGYANPRSEMSLVYDLAGASTDSRISFKFDAPNSMMGQTHCPATPEADVAQAIQSGLQSGIIDHPFNYTNYGYAAYDYDYWKTTASKDKWRSAWYEGYWSYLTKDDVADDFNYSGQGASLRSLSNGSWDAWGFQDGWESFDGVNPREPFVAVLPMVLNCTDTTLTVAQSAELLATIYHTAYTGQTPTWTSSNQAVASIDPSGKVTALSPGTTTLTASLSSDCYAQCTLTVNEKSFGFDDIVYWVGEGEKQAMLVVDWYDDKGPTLAWGYRWNGNASGADMLLAIAAADPRFTYMGGGGTIGGLGYDTNDNGSGCIVLGANEQCPTNGVITIPNYRYDNWKPKDETDRWQSGWGSGYWSYHTKDNINDAFKYSSVGFASRQLKDGSVDGWGYQQGWSSQTGKTPRSPYQAAEKPQVAPVKFSDVTYWVGEGANQTGIAIKWNDGKSEEALVWGYRWDGEKTLIDMIKDIAYADNRLVFLLNEDGPQVLGGIGFDVNGTNTTALIYNNDQTYPLYPFEGIVNTSLIDFDKFTVRDAEDYWQAGVDTKGKWNYLVMEAGTKQFTASSESIQSKVLTNNSWNAWNFDTNFAEVELGTTFAAVSEYVWETIDYTQGTFFVNEDWFTHYNGSVNFLQDNGKWVYRAYTRENRGEAFGATTQFGTIYGDNFYFVSKQEADAGDQQFSPGGRLVVADAKTLKKKAGFDDLGAIGDGRSFLGVNETTGYLAGNGGIALFDIENLSLGDVIDGTDGGGLYNGQIGTMLRVGDYVFACKQNKGILVIDANTHTLKETIECKAIGSIVQSKDGYLWASAYDKGLWKINPYTFVVEQQISIPKAAQIPSTWGAWTSGVLAASEKTNTLYWAKMNGSTMTFFGTKVFKYDIDTDDVTASDFLSSPFYELSGFDGKEAFYGSGLTVSPATDELIITSTSTGYGANYQKNRVHILDAQTAEVKNIYQLDDYYWFPAMAVFPDKYAPVVSDLLTDCSIQGEVKLYLGDKVDDSDSRNAAIIKTIVSISDEELLSAVIRNDSLVITPLATKFGEANISLQFNSNGKVVSKTITVSVEQTVIPLTGITLNSTTAKLSIAETLQLTATVSPADATYKPLTWSSANESIATVDQNGLVTALAEGSTTIIVRSEEYNQEARCELVVSKVNSGIGEANAAKAIWVDQLQSRIVVQTNKAGVAGIYHVSGKLINSIQLSEGDNYLDISALEKGMYIFIFDKNTLRFIK